MKDINSYKMTTYDYRKLIKEYDKKVIELNHKISNLEESVLKEKMLYNNMEEYYRNEINNIRSKFIINRIKNIIKGHIKNANDNSNNEENINEENINEENIKIESKITSIERKKVESSYNSWYEDNQDFSSYKSDIKPIAFYLPQFHTFKENDEWWGKGFTEWTNTKKSVPRFEGHYQPREPHDDIGYYYLDNIETIRKQVQLAKEHGLYGFAFYYYWFSGKTLMTKPIDLFLKDKKETFKFCLCWANENWTRRWDGLDKEVLIKQDYTEEDKYNFIKDIKKYLINDRYIRIDNKPLIMIYNPVEIPDYENMIKQWRITAKELGIGEIYIIQRQFIGNYDDLNTDLVDGEFDFAPNGFGHEGCRIECKYTSKAYDYKQLVDDIDNMYKEFYPYKDFYFSSTMGWDNSARRKKDYKVYCNYNPYSFYKWVRYTIRETRRRLPEDKRFIFINAWNEWAEGTYLEPDKKFGYTNINTLSKAVFDIPMRKEVAIVFDKTKRIKNSNKKLAIQIHAYYLDSFEYIVDKLKNIPCKYDLYITTDTDEKKKKIKQLITNLKSNKVIIDVYSNNGRDIYPFIKQMANYYTDYDYILKLHTKKTEDYDKDWFEYLISNLIGNKNVITQILDYLSNNDGIIYPEYYKDVLDMIEVGSNKDNIISLLDKMNLSSDIDFEEIDFPAGSMFYSTTDSIKELFDMNKKFMDEDYNNSSVDGTYAHAIERLFGIVPRIKGLKVTRYKYK